MRSPVSSSGGTPSGWSALFGGTVCVVPSGFFALRLWMSRRQPTVGGLVAGEAIKVFSTVALFVLVVVLFLVVVVVVVVGVHLGEVLLQAGEGYELVLHSLESLDHSVIKIINGHYTGRSEGSPITDLALKMLGQLEQDPSRTVSPYFNKNCHHI